MQIGRNGLAISCALRIGATTMHLKVRIRLLAAQYLAGNRRHPWIDGSCILLLLLALSLQEMGLRFGGGEVGLALLEMLDLAGRVLCAHEAAVQTAHFVTFRGRILVLELCKCSANVRVRVTPRRQS